MTDLIVCKLDSITQLTPIDLRVAASPIALYAQPDAECEQCAI